MNVRTFVSSAALAGIVAVGVSACSQQQVDQAKSSAATVASQASSAATSAGSKAASAASSAASQVSSHIEHKMDGGPAPAGMTPASHPKFPVGSKVTIQADHMPGMKGASGKVVGAYSTYTYAVDYTPVSGGPAVKDHKWVVQQEIKDAGNARLADGTKVTLEADHMPGMKGAKATIVSSTDETVYMVDYESHGMTMRNHKWVVQSELRAAS